MGSFEYYLIGINVLGFILYLINMWLYDHTAESNVDKLLTIVSLLGGSAGPLLAILLFDRKSVKQNMMSRVFVVCVFIIQVVLFLMYKGHHAEVLNFEAWKVFTEHKYVLIYLGIINVVTFIVFAIDKLNAIGHRTRIRIVTLLGLAFMGGSLGGLLAMYLLHHKTKKDYFTVGIPLIMLMQVVVVFYVLNMG
ncbi:DUF1294 domain-containing protein [Holdemanella biformis]|uniref:DUF1294 domain-containing protein n=1 Tax=Holdemanella biformis TaxID=1735 RepID=UPI002670B3ED|nr:DUF1294 domain-containing protein [Holdemanella biformis]